MLLLDLLNYMLNNSGFITEIKSAAHLLAAALVSGFLLVSSKL
jgi:hypothetical protein